ncbi:MAG: hyalin, partial [Planctomycetaceae bacterium]
TVLVKDIRGGGGSSFPSLLANMNGALYFQSNDGLNGFELWKSDGTSTGTVLVKENRSVASSYVKYLKNVNGTM